MIKKLTSVFSGLSIFIFAACLQVGTDSKSNTSTGSVTSPSTGTPALPPPQDTPPPSLQKVAVETDSGLVSRGYIAQVMQEVFYASAINASQAGRINTAIEDWAVKNPTSFGASCDPYETRAFDMCGEASAVSTTSVPLTVDGTTVRQLNRSKLCQRLLNLSGGVKAAAYNLGELTDMANPTTATFKEITDATLIKMFASFFRTRGMLPAELDAYHAFNQGMVTKAPTPVPLADRWHLILLMMCESSDWESP